MPWISADTRAENTNELDVVAINLHGVSPCDLRLRTTNWQSSLSQYTPRRLENDRFRVDCLSKTAHMQA